jgi:hypothetical protein
MQLRLPSDRLGFLLLPSVRENTLNQIKDKPITKCTNATAKHNTE